VSNESRTDGELLSAASRGDDAAFTCLVRRYVRRGTLLAVQLIGSVDDAEDVVQDAFTVVHQKARTFEPDRPFGPWFFAIVRRLAANRQARERRRSKLLRRWWIGSHGEPSSTNFERAISASVDAQVARKAMDELSSMQRACFELVVVRGLAIQEVAAMHGITDSTVRQHVFRARAVLRKSLGEASSADGDE
jgi:RNA polymerase sigma-70 factor (ECF subfamily)